MVVGARLGRAILGIAVAGAVVAAWVGGVAAVAPSPSQAVGSAGPNFVLVVVDDARADDLGPRFMPQANARIARQGARFTRFYAPFPLCCPARATMLTGQYSHNHGVVANYAPNGFDAFDDSQTLATWLDPTYQTAMIGKYLNGYGAVDRSYVPPGWDTWRAPLRGSVYNYTRFRANEDGTVRDFAQYSTAYYGDEAVSFVEAAATGTEPFFLFLSFVAPHDGLPHTDDDVPVLSPFVAPKYRNSYAGPPLPQDPTFDEADVSDKNPGIAGRSRLTDRDIAYFKEKLAQRRESLASVDDQVARVISELAATGELADTYVLLLSDNGFTLGEHRLRGDKKYLYEPTVRVPLQMRGPGVSAGRTVTVPTAQVDIAPTLLRLADIPTTPARVGLEIDGRSLMGALDNQVAPRPIVLEEHSQVTETDPGSWIRRGLMTQTFGYLRFPEFGNFEELYDLRVDPFQKLNVAGKASYAGALQRMREQWQDYRNCAGDACRASP